MIPNLNRYVFISIVCGFLTIGGFYLLWGIGMSGPSGSDDGRIVFRVFGMLIFFIYAPGMLLSLLFGSNPIAGLFLMGVFTFIFWLCVFYVVKHLRLRTRSSQSMLKRSAPVVAALVFFCGCFWFSFATVGPKPDPDPLGIAVEYGDTEKALQLLKNGADPNIRRPHSEDMPIHVAIHKGNTELVEALIKHGADIQATDLNRRTPMKLAIGLKSLPMVELLIKNGAEINIPPQNSKFENTSPLAVAVFVGDLSIVKALVNSGADVNRRYFDESPLALARKLGYSDVTDFLLSRGAKE